MLTTRKQAVDCCLRNIKDSAKDQEAQENYPT